MAKVAIIYHSGYGHTERLATRVLEGADAVDGASAVLIRVDELPARLPELNAADAIIFGTPTYMGSASAPFKAFMDSTSVIFAGSGWRDKLAAGFTNSAAYNGDKLNTLTQLAIFAAQHGMIWITLGLPPGNNSTQGSNDDLNRLGASLGAMAQSDADAPPDIAPPESDLETGRHLGRRVAEAALRWSG
jgi:NAD(P)H dehydrogenase (quinone)